MIVNAIDGKIWQVALVDKFEQFFFSELRLSHFCNYRFCSGFKWMYEVLKITTGLFHHIILAFSTPLNILQPQSVTKRFVLINIIGYMSF